MMNQDNPYAMNQTCKVCGEPAAGFHFGAFTCEGCKSFFGRSYNNLSSISDCKNNGECIINKKNRTACKACRLRKCLMVGMSKSGSRYGRRSNWFKIHCLLQEQQQQAAAAMAAHQNSQRVGGSMVGTLAGGLHGKTPTMPTSAAAAAALGMLGHAGPYAGLYQPRTKEELMMLGLEEYSKHPAGSPSVSSPDSHHSDSSIEVNGRANAVGGLHLASTKTSSSHAEAVTSCASVTTVPCLVPPPSANASHLRKEMSAFLPLSAFPALTAMPVMPPPNFLPPSHLLFPGYHPALYQHHAASLIKPSPEQQQAAAAAVQQLFNSSPRFAANTCTTSASIFSHETQEQHQQTPQAAGNSKMDVLRVSGPPTTTKTVTPPIIARLESPQSNNSGPNGSKTILERPTNPTTKSATSPGQTRAGDINVPTSASTSASGSASVSVSVSASAEELTKRFYLDAVLNSQRQTLTATATPTTSPNPLPQSQEVLNATATVATTPSIVATVPTTTTVTPLPTLTATTTTTTTAAGTSTTTTTTKLPYDHSISALVTPNSESERDYRYQLDANGVEMNIDISTTQQMGPIVNHHYRTSIQESLVERHSSSNGQDGCDRSRSFADDDFDPDDATINVVGRDDTNTNTNTDTDEDEDVDISMTPPRSPIKSSKMIDHMIVTHGSSNCSNESQDNPIDLSMKAISSVNSCHSSQSTGSHSSSSPDFRESFDDLEYKQKFFNNNNNNNNNDADKLDNECVMYRANKRKFEYSEDCDETLSNSNKRHLGKCLTATPTTSMPVMTTTTTTATTVTTLTLQKLAISPLDLTQKI